MSQTLSIKQDARRIGALSASFGFDDASATTAGTMAMSYEVEILPRTGDGARALARRAKADKAAGKVRKLS